METFTIRAAAERCEVSYQLMRKRVDRGTVRTVKRDGVRLIPRPELERVGLWPGSQPELAAGQELEHLRADLAAARAELETLRPMPAQLDAERQARELAEQAAYEQRAAAMIAEAKREVAQRELVAAATALEPLTDGGLLTGVRALMRLRRSEQPEPAGSEAAERRGDQQREAPARALASGV
ncbi:MAG: hypothetical protein ACR2J6_05405 [Thermoleophilaceae bacterium]